MQLTGTLAIGEVYVLAADAASPTFLENADESLSYPSVCHFTGNDAIGLFHNDVLIDVIGIPSEGSDVDGWNVAGVSGATAEHTIIRKSTVSTGNTDWAASAGTDTDNSEWVVHNQNYQELGYHGSGIFAITGADQTVLFGSTVTLDGSASFDSDGAIVSYLWTQNSGADVVLSLSLIHI